MIHPTQDSKYGIKDNKIVNMATGNPIPDDEPIMIFRGQDRNTAETVDDYSKRCRNQKHREAIFARLREFMKFRHEHPERMKEPDTVAG